MSEPTAVPGLAELLGQLEEKAEKGMARTTVSGRAVSRGADSLHIATASGIVAIPLSEISEVRPRGDDPRRVTVSVRSGDRIQHLRRVRQVGGPFTDSIFGEHIGNVTDPVSSNTLACYDTTTGQGDEQTSDDEICVTVDYLV